MILILFTLLKACRCINIYITIKNTIFLNMKASYTNLLNLYNSRLFLLLTVFFLTGCQIDQSVNILKEKLFSETEENLPKKKNLDNKEISEDEKDIQKY